MKPGSQLARAALLLPLLLGLGQGAEFRKFKTNVPAEPGNHGDLVVEHLWDFDPEDKPLQIKFIPGGNGALLTIHKYGSIRHYPSVNVGVEQYTKILDINPDVWSFGDHGLMAMEFHPDWAKGTKKGFIIYTGEPKDTRTLPNNPAVTPIRPPSWGAGPPGTTGYRWGDICPCLDCCVGAECAVLGGENRKGEICEHPYYLDRIALNLDANPPTAALEMTLLQAACGSSSTHGPGDMLFIDGDLIFSNGDGSQYVELDTGFEDDACFEPLKTQPQGQFRSARPNFINGKIVKIPGALINSPRQLTQAQVTYVAAGLRNPVRMYYHAAADDLYIGDVGFGDAGTSERIFKSNGIAGMGDLVPVNNYGWPCIEGVRRQVLSAFAVWDAPSEQERLQYLTDAGYATCGPIAAAVRAYVAGTPPPAGADLNWQPPQFEYRVGAMDPNFPTLCNNPYGAITSVFLYEGNKMPPDFQGRFFFSDYAKQCTWYFPNNAAGKPDFTQFPSILLSGTGFVSMKTGPDGFIYGIDFQNGRLMRMFQRPAGELPQATAPPTPPQTKYDVGARTVPLAGQCFNPKNVPFLQWSKRGDGSFDGTLRMSAATVTTSQGSMRTRVWNGLMPGPIISMKACGVYHLTVVNDMAQWPAPEGMMNTMHDPSFTNLHTHGLHISGDAPADDVATLIGPGESYEYTYTVPCDHSGGTNWYHPHKHGSSALQTGGGAAGMLLIESSAREASNMPADIANMPEQFLTIQEFSPGDTQQYADLAYDALFTTDLTKPFTLVNGCEVTAMTVEAGQWTRLHILNVGHQYNSILTIESVAAGAAQCEVGLLSKDGVWVAQVPRAVAGNRMFLSLSSRIDIALRCSVANSVHNIMYQHIGDTIFGQPQTLGTITAVPSARAAAPALTAWAPCRPAYLTDLTAIPPAQMGPAFSLEVREGMNSNLFTGPDNYMWQMQLGQAQQWTIVGTDQHPLHVHVNHMQVSTYVSAKNQFAGVPNWIQPGDWVDTLSALGTLIVLIRPERFIGRQYLHCHITAHADIGVMGVMKINGIGSDALTSPAITDYGTCPAALKQPTPYSGTNAKIPGTVQAEAFDRGGEGIAYHNVNIDTNAAPSVLRVGEASVELSTDGPATTVSTIRAGEWLRYSVTVATAGYYNTGLSQSSVAPAAGIAWSLWVDVEQCPPLSSKLGRVGAVSNAAYSGTGAYTTFQTTVSPVPGALTVGDHSLLLCFENDALTMHVDSFTLAYCGTTPEACLTSTGFEESPISNLQPPVPVGQAPGLPVVPKASVDAGAAAGSGATATAAAASTVTVAAVLALGAVLLR